MAGSLDNFNHVKNRYLFVPGCEDENESFYLAIVAGLYKDKIEEEMIVKDNAELVRLLKKTLLEDFVLPEQDEMFLSLLEENEVSMRTAEGSYDPKNFAIKQRAVQKLMGMFRSGYDDPVLSTEEILKKMNAQELILGSPGWDKALRGLDENARKDLREKLHTKLQQKKQCTSNPSVSPEKVRYESLVKANAPLIPSFDERAALRTESIETEADQVDELIYSGVSLQQLFFVLKNAARHDFSVSICSLFNDKSYVVQTSLGEILDSTKPRRKHIIPLFRISVHDEHSCHVKSAHGLDYLLENNLYNRNFSKEWKERVLEDSESSEEALQRARLQVVFGKTPKYKLERKKDFKQAYFSKQKSELKTLKINYFWIKNVDGFLKQYYSSSSGSSDEKLKNPIQKKFCPRCFAHFYRGSDEVMKLHLLECRGQKVSTGREVMPTESKRHTDCREFTDYGSFLKAPLIVFADFEAALISMDKVCYYCARVNYSTRCRCEQSLESGFSDFDLINREEEEEEKEDTRSGKGQKGQKKPKTEKEAEHRILTFGFVIVSSDNKVLLQQSHQPVQSDKDIEEDKGRAAFIEALLDLEPRIAKYRKWDDKPEPTERELDNFLFSERCCICKDLFDFSVQVYPDCYLPAIMRRGLINDRRILSDIAKQDRDMISLIHHHHLKSSYASDGRSRYIGPAHMKCNTQLERSVNKTKVLLHNFSGYDCALITRGLSKNKRVWHLSALSYNTNKIRAIYCNSFIICDSLSHIRSSISKLSQNLVDANHTFPILRQCDLILKANDDISDDEAEEAPAFIVDEEKFELMKKKSCFPYSLATSISALEKYTEFPEKRLFYNDITEEDIEDEVYKTGQKVFSLFQCEDLFQFMLIYMMIDIFLLAEIFLHYQDTMAGLFDGLQCSHYLTLPSFCEAAAMYKTQLKLPYIIDNRMYCTLERTVRGGFSFSALKMCRSRDATPWWPQHRHLLYLDCVSLYPFVMQAKIGYKDYRFLTSAELESFPTNPLDVDADGKKGYFVCCTFDFSDPKCQELMQDWPFLPYLTSKNFDELSPFSQHLHRKHGKVGKNTERWKTFPKLVADMSQRTLYWCHIKVSQLAVKLGIKVSPVQHCIEFTQDNILAPYLDLCIKARGAAKNTFERQAFKELMNGRYTAATATAAAASTACCRCRGIYSLPQHLQHAAASSASTACGSIYHCCSIISSDGDRTRKERVFSSWPRANFVL